MKCENCKKEIKNPLLKCPYCSADIPEYARAVLRKESTKEKAQEEALIRQKRKKYVRLSLITWVIGVFVIFPVTFYFGLTNEWYWLPILGMILWILALAYIGIAKGAILCPFCGSPIGRTWGKYCPHCRSQFRD